MKRIMVMTKKGSITIEAMIGIFVVLMLTINIISIFQLYTKEDHIAQEVLDGVDYLTAGHYVYERIGFTDLLSLSERFPQIQGSLIEDLSEYILDGLEDQSKTFVLTQYLKGRLKQAGYDCEINLELFDDWVSIEVDYNHNLAFGRVLSNTLVISTRLWLFGDGELDPPSLLDHLQKDKVSYVYITKTGGRYHEKGCFYLKRSTTDKSSIRKLSLDQAKLQYQPCKRCILKEVNPWK